MQPYRRGCTSGARRRGPAVEEREFRQMSCRCRGRLRARPPAEKQRGARCGSRRHRGRTTPHPRAAPRVPCHAPTLQPCPFGRLESAAHRPATTYCCGRRPMATTPRHTLVHRAAPLLRTRLKANAAHEVAIGAAHGLRWLWVRRREQQREAEKERERERSRRRHRELQRTPPPLPRWIRSLRR
uniref:Uncharacterized protein n=1 Tax=Arundo donax TaxID=35708 RepID=A0A0A9D4E3_ARUDO